jgi:hypothetical protein
MKVYPLVFRLYCSFGFTQGEIVVFDFNLFIDEEFSKGYQGLHSSFSTCGDFPSPPLLP